MSHQPRPNPICTVCRKPILPGAGRTRRGLTSTHVECEKRHRPGSSRPKSESPERPRATVVSTSGRHQDKESSASPLSAYHAGGLEGARTGCDARLSHAPFEGEGKPPRVDAACQGLPQSPTTRTGAGERFGQTDSVHRYGRATTLIKLALSLLLPRRGSPPVTSEPAGQEEDNYDEKYKTQPATGVEAPA